MSDLISREDAIDAVLELNTDGRVSWKDAVIDMLDALPSAEARPTVIRSRTLLPTKDFKEWAKRIREVNPNAVVIPCDAEVASAEARPTGEWIPVSERLPKEDGEYLVASGEFIYVYSYGIPLMPMNERNRRWGWYESTSEGDFYMDVDAWMPLPEPYRGGEDE